MRTTIVGLGLLLVGCGGRSADPRIANEGHAGAAGARDTGPSSSGGFVDSGSQGTSDGGTAVLGTGGEGDAISSVSGATSAAGSGTGGGAARSGTAGENAIMGEAGAPSAEGPCSGEVCRLAVNPSPLWVTHVKGYGRGPAWIRFSQTDESVSVGTGQSSYFETVLDRSSGQVVSISEEDRTFVATDPSGRWVVRRPQLDCVVLDNGRTAFSFRCTLYEDVRFSGDGSALAHHTCLSEADQLLKLDVYDTTSGELIATTTANLPCLYGSDDWNSLVDSERRRTLFANPKKDDLYVFDWATQSITSHSIHSSFPPSLQPLNHEGTILNLSLSHDGQRLVSVGAADGLAWHDPKTLEVEARIPDVPFFNLYDTCFCTYLSESPVGWSPADEIYATAQRNGGIELRSTTTNKTLAILEPPSDPEVLKITYSKGFGPTLIQFAPDLRHLVALYPGHVVGYSLSR